MVWFAMQRASLSRANSPCLSSFTLWFDAVTARHDESVKFTISPRPFQKTGKPAEDTVSTKTPKIYRQYGNRMILDTDNIYMIYSSCQPVWMLSRIIYSGLPNFLLHYPPTMAGSGFGFRTWNRTETQAAKKKIECDAVVRLIRIV